MRFDMTVRELAEYTACQLNMFFPDTHTVAPEQMLCGVQLALDRAEYCFRHINYAAYSENGEAMFDVLHSDQYCHYLYFLSNSLYHNQGDPRLCKKLFYLNKALHAMNCMYDTDLPDIFWIVHAIGIALGKANYSNYLVLRHNCTIGGMSGEFPTMGEKVILSAGASLIGRCSVGDNVMLGPGCAVVKTDIPANTLVTNGGSYVSRTNSDKPARACFHLD